MPDPRLRAISVPRLTRRAVLGGAAASGVALIGRPHRGRAAEPQPVALEARTGIDAQLLDPPEPRSPVWAYNGRVPGPTLRVRQGEELFVRLRNGLAEPTTIHWHGIRIANAMDGVGNMTQAPVAPGASFDYRFRCPDAGTFWYHPHTHEFEQLARGLAGALIVAEPTPIAVDQDLVLLIKDWRILSDGRIAGGFGALIDKAHAGRVGNTITVNGLHFADFPVKAGERVRVRLINASNARVLKLNLERASPKIIAVDGQPITPRELYVGGLDLPPGGRMDLVVDMIGDPGASVALTEVSKDRIELARFSFDARVRARAEPLAAPVALAPNPVAQPRLGPDALAVPLVMTGGAMSQMKGAMVHGKALPIEEMIAKHGLVWAFNGVAGHEHDEPLFRVALGRTVMVRIVNDTRWEHAMHVHGHHFRVVARTVRDKDDYLWDTLLMPPGETAEVAFVADNPGKWMLHCHMLEHQLSGMMTWFEVT